MAAPTLYHHFGGKDGLLQVVAEDAFTAQAARLLLAGLGAAADLFTAAEEALLRQWLRVLTQHPASPRDRREEGQDE